MNYGHSLKFGTFITPKSGDAQTVVNLAKHSEALGYDLVTFQDHPYQPAFLDAWTLMSWVAGQTERIHIAGNVLNIPLRSPSVLARSSASLDLLSNGRFDLALGAGGFWDAIHAMGEPKRTPSESVEALSEAIDIIRALLDTTENTPLKYHGKHYRMNGVKRGPVSAHEIPIWVGGLKPKMLRLIGEKADGWLPSSMYLDHSAIGASNQIIDEAADAAGRDPREIRRMMNIAGKFTPEHGEFLNGPSTKWVDDLLPLVVEHGFSTFILMADDAEVMDQFAQEVIPALREAVARELPDGLSEKKIRRASVKAKRRALIDYEGVPESLVDTVIEPGDNNFSRVRSTYMRGGAPGIVFQVRNVEDVVAALAFARQHKELPLSIRSGGHGIRGRSTNDGGIVINLAKLNTIEIVDQATRRVRIGAGARWMEVAQALEPYGWALSSGDYGGVGVGGLATAGGIGWLARKHGLTIDHVRAVEMVLADGSIVHASEDENPDLFWAVRGAGAGFGIVTWFEFEVDEVSDVGWAQFVFDASDTAEFLESWGHVVETSPRDLTSFLIMGAPRRDQPMIAQTLALVDSDNPETIISQLQPLANIAPMYDQSVVITTYANLMANAQLGDHHGQGNPVGRSGLVRHFTPEFAAAAERLIRSGSVFFFQVRSIGGAVSDVPDEATPFNGRDANFHVTALGMNRDQLNTLWDTTMKDHMVGNYLNFETDTRPERMAEAFLPSTLERLNRLKAQYDPENLFKDNLVFPTPTPKSQS